MHSTRYLVESLLVLTSEVNDSESFAYRSGCQRHDFKVEPMVRRLGIQQFDPGVTYRKEPTLSQVEIV